MTTWSYRYESTAFGSISDIAHIRPMIQISALISWPAFFRAGLSATLSLTQA